MEASHTVFKKLSCLRLIPVIAMDSAEHADALAEALLAGGLPCAEVTFRTAAAADAMAMMAAHRDLLVGAGTVLTVDQVKQAVDCGAQFMVAPGFSPKVVAYCVEQDIPIAPGVSNPTDIQMALEFGLDVLKFFPAEAFGGLSTLSAISGPFAGLRFIASGGITPKNLQSYLKAPQVIACGGSWLAESPLIAAKNFPEITRRVAEAVALTCGCSDERPNSELG